MTPAEQPISESLPPVLTGGGAPQPTTAVGTLPGGDLGGLLPVVTPRDDGPSRTAGSDEGSQPARPEVPIRPADPILPIIPFIPVITLPTENGRGPPADPAPPSRPTRRPRRWSTTRRRRCP